MHILASSLTSNILEVYSENYIYSCKNIKLLDPVKKIYCPNILAEVSPIDYFLDSRKDYNCLKLNSKQDLLNELIKLNNHPFFANNAFKIKLCL
jgi:hypothetical protein